MPKKALCSRYPLYETEEFRTLRSAVLHLPQVRNTWSVHSIYTTLQIYRFGESVYRISKLDLYSFLSLSTLKAILLFTVKMLVNFGCTSCSLFHAVDGGLLFQVCSLHPSTSWLVIIVVFSTTGCSLLLDSCLDAACSKFQRDAQDNSQRLFALPAPDHQRVLVNPNRPAIECRLRGPGVIQKEEVLDHQQTSDTYLSQVNVHYQMFGDTVLSALKCFVDSLSTGRDKDLALRYVS